MTVGRTVSAWPPWECPAHGRPLEDLGDTLVCEAGHSYPRRHGIPRFVEFDAYAAAFGTQWNRYRQTQLDSYTGLPITEERTRRCLGEELWRTLTGKQVLECGCGAGRFTEILLDRGARVTSVDLSNAVEANRDNFPQDDRHRIAQADIECLPFALRQFDVVFCLGVVQHTPRPERTFARLYDHVAPGGTLVVDHYEFSWSWLLSLAPLYRLYFRRLPPERGMRQTEALVERLLPMHRRAAKSRPLRLLLNRFSPVMSYYKAYPQLPDAVQREWALLDTHDSLTDWYKRLRTRSRIERTLRRLGLVDIWCERGGNGIEARGRRPLS